MSQDASIQYRAPHKADGFGFENGQRVPMVQPKIEGDEEQAEEKSAELDFIKKLEDLKRGYKDLSELGARVVMLLYVFREKSACATQSYRELALELGVSDKTAKHRLRTFAQCLQAECGDLIRTGNIDRDKNDSTYANRTDEPEP